MKHTIFFLGTLALLLVITQVANANVYGDQIQPVPSTVPLEWKDTGKVVYPGVHFTVTIHAEGSRYLGGLADAGISINQLLFGITECGTSLDPHACLVMGGHSHDLGSLSLFTKASYDATLEFTIYCNGTMFVRAINYPDAAHEYILPNDTSVPILFFEEGNQFLHSNVEVGRIEEWTDCGTDYSGELPQPGESPEEPSPWDFLNDAKKALILVGAGLAALIGVLIVLSIYNTLRPR